MKAYVLINVQPGSIQEVVNNLRRIDGVIEANMTFGQYDVITVLELRDVNSIGQSIASQIQPIPGILETYTCLVVEI